ncbi:hypothetical protein AA0120_g8498 [Alternaria tenuissima]|nr:hypothetical protein AA0120_g8498 [Alternaria tenuissima]
MAELRSIELGAAMDLKLLKRQSRAAQKGQKFRQARACV